MLTNEFGFHKGVTECVTPLGVKYNNEGVGRYRYTCNCNTLNTTAFYSSQGRYTGSEGFKNELPLFRDFVFSVSSSSIDALKYYGDVLDALYLLINNPNFSSVLQVLIRLHVVWPRLVTEFNINPAHCVRTAQRLEELGIVHKMSYQDARINPIVRAVFAARNKRAGQNPLPSNQNFRKLSVYTWTSSEWKDFFASLFESLELFDPVLDEKLSKYTSNIQYAVKQHERLVKTERAIQSAESEAKIDWNLLKEAYFCYVKGILETILPNGKKVRARDWPRLLQEASEHTGLSENEIITKIRHELGLYVDEEEEGGA